MNASDLLDYSLGQLEGDAMQRAALEVEADPTLAVRVERVRTGIAILCDDGGPTEVPSGLAARTRTFVLAEINHRPAVLEFSPSRRRFRVEDFAVAATIFIASLLALTPAIIRSKERWGRAACSYNLQKVGLRLHQYAATNNSYPFVASDDEIPHAGAIICRLNERGYHVDPADLRCPSTGSEEGERSRVPSLSEVAQRLRDDPNCINCRMLDNDYAFHVGNYAEVDDAMGPRGKPIPLPARPTHSIPIIGDQPGFDSTGRIFAGNSPNHGGQGQNVLFADGHTSWHNSRYISPADSDLYLNRANRSGYGLGPEDGVLVPAALRVDPN
jgi:prepilin-type processing-associated H-X9-DG protein